jgi:hypothetical protein
MINAEILSGRNISAERLTETLSGVLLSIMAGDLTNNILNMKNAIALKSNIPAKKQEAM